MDQSHETHGSLWDFGFISCEGEQELEARRTSARIAMSGDIEAFKVLISGKVQGVFFRASMKKVAEECKLVGWVRNLKDGSVESLVQGRSSDVARILKWCNTGPRNAIVFKVEIKEVNPETDLRNFSIVY